MLKTPAALIIGFLLSAQAALAEAPRVVADIAPVHSLLAQVMEGAGTPDLILRPGASPHGYAMRPSEAAALQRADLVVWMGEGLTPWLEGPIENLSGDVPVLELLALKDTRVLSWREGFGQDGHDEHEDEGHEDPGDHTHNHGATDPHAWLDPENAALWLAAFARQLAALDPANSDLYYANATAGQAELDALKAEIAARMAPLHEAPILLLHDGYHYFEDRFELHGTVALLDSDAAKPGAARIKQIKTLAAARGITCGLAEPQLDTRLLTTVLGDNARIGLLDPLGSHLAPGPALYPLMLRDMAHAIAACGAP